jgi:hypothetical protein
MISDLHEDSPYLKVFCGLQWWASLQTCNDSRLETPLLMCKPTSLYPRHGLENFALIVIPRKEVWHVVRELTKNTEVWFWHLHGVGAESLKLIWIVQMQRSLEMRLIVSYSFFILRKISQRIIALFYIIRVPLTFSSKILLRSNKCILSCAFYF